MANQLQGRIFGVPREILAEERRVSATPETVKQLVADGAEILVEEGAGVGAYFTDQQYQEAGAAIISDVQELYQRADVILKVKEPRYHEPASVHEAEMMREGQYLIAFLHPAAPLNHDLVRLLAEQGVTSLTLDGVPRITRAQPMDALTSMSTVAGYKGFLMAAESLGKFVPMLGTAVGMIPPAHAFVIGAGVCGLQAIAAAKRLGAVVHAADIRPDACEQAASLGAKNVDLAIPPEIAVGSGGYAESLSEEWLAAEREQLAEAVAQADIIILTALVPGKIAPVLLTADMVRTMAPGSVIVDIAVDQGGNCELTQFGKRVVENDVTIDGTPNIPGTVPISATTMLAKNILHYVRHVFPAGRDALDLNDEILSSCLVTRAGEIVHAGTLEAMELSKRSVQ